MAERFWNKILRILHKKKKKTKFRYCHFGFITLTFFLLNITFTFLYLLRLLLFFFFFLLRRIDNFFWKLLIQHEMIVIISRFLFPFFFYSKKHCISLLAQMRARWYDNVVVWWRVKVFLVQLDQSLRKHTGTLLHLAHEPLREMLLIVSIFRRRWSGSPYGLL